MEPETQKIPMVFNSINDAFTTGTSWLFGITLKWGLRAFGLPCPG